MLEHERVGLPWCWTSSKAAWYLCVTCKTYKIEPKGTSGTPETLGEPRSHKTQQSVR